MGSVEIDERELIDRLNGQPVNQKAKEMLEMSGQEPQPDCLHCVQLACWALDRGYFSVEDAVFETIRAMIEWKPVRLMNFLLIGGHVDYEPKGWDKSRGPEELAQAILTDIEAKAYIAFPWYGSVSD